jgi:hypothetical protein
MCFPPAPALTSFCVDVCMLSSSPWRRLPTLQDEPYPPSSWTGEDEEVYLKILSTNDQGASNGSLASPLELEDILYELEGT